MIKNSFLPRLKKLNDQLSMNKLNGQLSMTKLSDQVCQTLDY
jgi:hypothetical protein